ncbi:hypothetical protein BC939DRAFT_440761 [Gamsiella multidivaricata]|uniref:uncharacterized protein n=1 Tax=Gamsiella multidivaricata TaxID=101098 RepID=UPI00222068F1|nr:uncharacterized protein BC939DRAFT_440761 [Gamsiella multidivaricata]KAI7829828.1 hypothetical protein BC939DRAFT_440761 [Gamsiella multidivaricata]
MSKDTTYTRIASKTCEEAESLGPQGYLYNHRDLATRSKQLFHLTAYSVTGAALMGSSIGLVVYQRRQLSILNSTAGPIASSPSSPSPVTTTTLLQQLYTFVLSTWLPFLIWWLALMTTSIFIRSRKVVPSVLSARTAILTSQAAFVVFWVILAAVQEVEEKLVSKAWEQQETESYGAQDRTMQYDGMAQERALLISETSVSKSMQAVCVLWYLAVAVLGIATGLLTTSSSILEEQLESEYQELVQWEDSRCSTEKAEEDSTKGGQGMSRSQRSHGRGAVARWYTLRQQMALMLLLLVLLITQVQFFRWIISQGKDEGAAAGGISSPLAAIGIVSGVTMMRLGAKLIPR